MQQTTCHSLNDGGIDCLGKAAASARLWRSAPLTYVSRRHGVAVRGAEAFTVGRNAAPHVVRIKFNGALSQRFAPPLKILAFLSVQPIRLCTTSPDQIEGLVVAKRSVQISLRTHNDDLIDFNLFHARHVHERGVKAVIAEMRLIVGGNRAYLTFDIDCLDPAFAPGTGTPVAGGLSSVQPFAILRGRAGIDFVGMDVVEVAPAYDVAEIAVLAAAHIAQEGLVLVAMRQDVKR